MVRGIGFDATCSLVVVDKEGQSVTVSPSLDPKRNIILWKDHRAIKEANDINGLGHPVLRFVGGCVSPEMEPPKLLWLRRHLLKESWSKAGHFFDLADYLVYRSTGIPARYYICVVSSCMSVSIYPSIHPSIHSSISSSIYPFVH